MASSAELKLRMLSGSFTIHRLDPLMAVPTAVRECETHFIGQTPEELSIVCPSHIEVMYAKSEPNWACFRVEGPLDFALYGILARISGALAAQRISIFAVSTFDTDYILVKEADLERAQKVLMDQGYAF
ncbi:MAG: ACT domain-containing protein [Bacteroidetes bacterium]|nr:ACT domain-containing protein [Bacteroidota bacterium]MDA1333318.1 ACT domain-containing protein [Bacteroidota bacterium]